MDLDQIPLLTAIKSRMKWLTGNQSVLAKNIANADTPGYKAESLTPQDFSDLVDRVAPPEPRNTAVRGPGQVSLQVTQAGHMGGAALPGGGGQVEDAAFEIASPDENTVDLDEQLIGVAQTQMEYSLVVNLYRKNIGFLNTALRGSEGNR